MRRPLPGGAETSIGAGAGHGERGTRGGDRGDPNGPRSDGRVATGRGLGRAREGSGRPHPESCPSRPRGPRPHDRHRFALVADTDEGPDIRRGRERTGNTIEIHHVSHCDLLLGCQPVYQRRVLARFPHQFVPEHASVLPEKDGEDTSVRYERAWRMTEIPRMESHDERISDYLVCGRETDMVDHQRVWHGRADNARVRAERSHIRARTVAARRECRDDPQERCERTSRNPYRRDLHNAFSASSNVRPRTDRCHRSDPCLAHREQRNTNRSGGCQRR
jgi:hypothetical protein